MNGAPPASIIKDGNIKASIWENEGRNGTYFTATFAKTYRDKDNNLRDTNVFNNNDLLRVSELARQAYGRTNDLRQEMKQEQQSEQSTDGRATRAAKFEQQHSQDNANQLEQGRGHVHEPEL